MRYSHFNCFIPVNNISTKCKCIYVNDVYVTLLGAHVQPFAAYGQMYASDPAKQTNTYTFTIYNVLYIYSSIQSIQPVQLVIVTVRAEIWDSAQCVGSFGVCSTSEWCHRRSRWPGHPRWPEIGQRARRTRTRPRVWHVHRRRVGPS